MISRVPASFFSIVVGVAGLGNAWRLAAGLWSYPAWIGEAILLAATAIWAILVLLYGAKWLFATAYARTEGCDSVQCCFIGLAPMSTMLIALAMAPYHRPLALALFLTGAAGTLVFATWRTGVLWQGRCDAASTTAALLYLPTVAGCFIVATVAAEFGFDGWGAPLFGAGFFTWLALDSVLLHRLFTTPLQGALRPTLGIQLAPPTVGTVALLTIPEAPVLLAEMMLGYGIVQTAVMVRLLPWLDRYGFSAGFWAFTFGLDALAFGLMRLQQLGVADPLAQAAWPAFVVANAAVGGLTADSLWLLLRGRLLPSAAAPSAPALASAPQPADGPSTGPA